MLCIERPPISNIVGSLILYGSDYIRATMANSEDPDEMLHNASYHQGLHCLLWQIDLNPF